MLGIFTPELTLYSENLTDCKYLGHLLRQHKVRNIQLISSIEHARTRILGIDINSWFSLMEPLFPCEIIIYNPVWDYTYEPLAHYQAKHSPPPYSPGMLHWGPAVVRGVWGVSSAAKELASIVHSTQKG